MDYFKSQLDRIQQQLGGLSASQKMLTASLVAIMVMTLVWWGRYAGTADVTPVLDMTLSSADAGNIQRHLRAAGITSQVSGGQVLVPSDRQEEALAVLSIADALPTDSADAFDEMVKKINPFMPNSQTEAVLLAAKQRMLEGVLRNYEGVKSVRVFITPKSGSRLGGGNEAAASVNFTMKSSDAGLGSKEVQGAANLIARAEPGLRPKMVAVMVNLKPQRVNDPDDPMSIAASGELSEMKAQWERHYEEKIDRKLDYIPGRIVTCTVNVDTTTTQTQSRTVDADKSLQKEIETEMTNSESADATPVAAEPGVMPNVSANQGSSFAGGGGGGTTTSTNERTKFVVIPNEEVKSTTKGAGDFQIVSASVQVPRSYFVAMAKGLSGSKSSEEPAEEAVLALAESEMAKIREVAMSTCGIKDQNEVVVNMYTDVMPLLAAAAVAEVPEPSAVTASIQGHYKEIAIGALAVVSLFMLMMMVRKGTTAPLVIPAAEPVLPQNLDTMSEIAGIVGDGDPMLDGMELDEDAVKAQHMLGQVQTMVKENPDGAANLVKRWMNRT